MDENTQPEANSDELIMQQQRQIENEVFTHPKNNNIPLRLCVCLFLLTCIQYSIWSQYETPHLPIHKFSDGRCSDCLN